MGLGVILAESMGIWRLWDGFWGCLYLWKNLGKKNHTPRSWGKKIKGKRRKVKEKGKRGAALNHPKNQ